MRSISCLASLALSLCCPWRAAAASADTTIWFDAPARNFAESCPLGNGRLGAMLFGGVNEERIVLNESSVWSGSKQDADREGAARVLPEIRRLLLDAGYLAIEICESRIKNRALQSVFTD